MTNYSNNPAHVRGELFSPSGKWRYTITIDMTGFYHATEIHKTVVEAARQTPSSLRGVVDGAVSSKSDYILVVPDPYHKNAYPIMIHLNKYPD
jgi:hypothetical protein